MQDRLISKSLKPIWDKVGIATFREKLLAEKKAGKGPKDVAEWVSRFMDPIGKAERDDEWDVDYDSPSKDKIDFDPEDPLDDPMDTTSSASTSKASQAKGKRIFHGGGKNMQEDAQKMEQHIDKLHDPRFKNAMTKTVKAYKRALRKEGGGLDLGEDHSFDHYKDMSLPEKGQPLVAPGVLKKTLKKPALSKKAGPKAAKKHQRGKKRKAKAEAEGAPASKKALIGKNGWKVMVVVRGEGDENAGAKFKKWQGPDGQKYRTKGEAEEAGYVE